MHIYTNIIFTMHIYTYIRIQTSCMCSYATFIHSFIHTYSTVHKILIPIILRVLTPENTTVASLLGEADGASALLRGTLREGLVFKANSATCRYNFKAISNQFLLKHDG